MERLQERRNQLDKLLVVSRNHLNQYVVDSQENRREHEAQAQAHGRQDGAHEEQARVHGRQDEAHKKQAQEMVEQVRAQHLEIFLNAKEVMLDLVKTAELGKSLQGKIKDITNPDDDDIAGARRDKGIRAKSSDSGLKEEAKTNIREILERIDEYEFDVEDILGRVSTMKNTIDKIREAKEKTKKRRDNYEKWQKFFLYIVTIVTVILGISVITIYRAGIGWTDTLVALGALDSDMRLLPNWDSERTQVSF